ncbi:MAG: serine/threonine-protein kinase [Candidatus Eremiobacterota bacterium]
MAEFSQNKPLTEGTILEHRYKIISLVKSGGMGAVYKASDEKLDCICAIKELIPPFGSGKIQEQSALWFQREAKLLARLDHPNLPKVFDYFLNRYRYYLVMTFIDGEDLDNKLKREGNPGFPEEKVIEWSKEILNLLCYLHNQNPPVIYRDIKPGNIMIHNDGRIMLIDFGIARVISQNDTGKTAIGTGGFAPVEQCRGKAEARSDIYSLGATIHCLLTGIEPLPFKFEPVRNLVPSISPDLEKIIIKSLKDNLDERFSTAGEMLVSIEKISKKHKKNKREDKQLPGIYKKEKVAPRPGKEIIDRIFYEDEDVTLTGTQLIIQENEYNLCEIDSVKVKREMDRRYLVTNGCIAFAMFISIFFLLEAIIATEAGLFILIFIGILYIILLITVRDYNYILLVIKGSDEIKAFISKDKKYMENLSDKINEVLK